MEIEVTALYEKESVKYFNLRFAERFVILIIMMIEAVSLFFINDMMFWIVAFWCVFTLFIFTLGDRW